MLLLDLSSAFDTVDHNILLSRLEIRFGFAGVALKWFQLYPVNRYQTVCVGQSAQSTPQELKYGVRQGPVLGPLLFCAYTVPLGDLLCTSYWTLPYTVLVFKITPPLPPVCSVYSIT